MCSPTSSHSGSQTRLVHLSGGGANDSGLSSLSGGFAVGPILHQHNFSPEVRGELEELEPVRIFINLCGNWTRNKTITADA